MPSTDRKLELKARTSVAQTGSQPFVYAKGLIESHGPHYTFKDYAMVDLKDTGLVLSNLSHFLE
jgi:hypothetical protein